MNRNERREKISEIIGAIDEKYLREAEEAAPAAEGTEKSVLRLPRRKGWVLAAAAVLVLVLAGASVFMISAEAKEYKAAVAFFEENKLSMEGLSRAEVKEVYRDITTRRFVSAKTEELIREQVAGLEILQEEPSPEELAAAWDRVVWRDRPVRKTGFSYQREIRYKVNEANGLEDLDRSIVTCYQDGAPIWTVEIPEFTAEGYVHGDGRTVVWGSRHVYTYNSKYDNISSYQTSWLACVDDQGAILWKHPLWHRFTSEYIASVLYHDGIWTVLSRGDLSYLGLLEYDSDGNLLHSAKTGLKNAGIYDGAVLEDGYLVRIGSHLKGQTARVAKIDRDANILEIYDYEAEDCYYTLTGMVQYGGKIYLSGYATPKRTDTKVHPYINPSRDEIYDVLQKLIQDNLWEIPSEELTPMVRGQYTAILLVCDSGYKTPATFYSVKGSLGGALSVNAGGELEWDVESITTTFFSPATNSFTIGGQCAVYRYTFDENGTLLGRDDTGETVPYRR